MQLVGADIRGRQPVAVADLGIVVFAVRADVRHRLRAERRVGLERDAPALLVGMRDQVLVDGARLVAVAVWQDAGGKAGGRRGADDLGAAIVIAPAIVADQREGQVGRGVGDDHAAKAVMLVPVHAPVIVRDVADVARVIAVKAGEAALDRLAHRNVECGARAIFIAVAGEERALDRAGEYVAGTLGDDVDHAGARVLAEQRALRTTQHFDPVDVNQVAERLAGATVDHAVDDGGDRWLARDREGRGADPAQEQRLVDRRARLAKVERRHEILRAFEVHCPLRGDLRARDDRHRDRHVLKTLGALLRRDDDFARHGRIGRARDGSLRLCCVLRPCRCT